MRPKSRLRVRSRNKQGVDMFVSAESVLRSARTPPLETTDRPLGSNLCVFANVASLIPLPGRSRPDCVRVFAPSVIGSTQLLKVKVATLRNTRVAPTLTKPAGQRQHTVGDDITQPAASRTCNASSLSVVCICIATVSLPTNTTSQPTRFAPHTRSLQTHGQHYLGCKAGHSPLHTARRVLCRGCFVRGSGAAFADAALIWPIHISMQRTRIGSVDI